MALHSYPCIFQRCLFYSVAYHWSYVVTQPSIFRRPCGPFNSAKSLRLLSDQTSPPCEFWCTTFSEEHGINRLIHNIPGQTFAFWKQDGTWTHTRLFIHNSCLYLLATRSPTMKCCPSCSILHFIIQNTTLHIVFQLAAYLTSFHDTGYYALTDQDNNELLLREQLNPLFTP